MNALTPLHQSQVPAPADVAALPIIHPTFDTSLLAGVPTTPDLVLGSRHAGPIQPCADVAGYLATRRPVPQITGDAEHALWLTLPHAVRAETQALLGAFATIANLVRAGSRVSPAVRQVLRLYAEAGWGWAPKTLRNQYDEWSRQQDWLCAVNWSKAPGGWRSARSALPDAFLKFVAAQFGRSKRTDARRQALFRIRRWWTTGRDDAGQPVTIPGYGTWQEWWQKTYGTVPLPAVAPIPTGWSYENVRDQLHKRQAFIAPVAALMVQGSAAAKPLLPAVHSTRIKLRFCERLQFDDVKTDWRIIDTTSGQINDLWLLVARDVATTLLLGFGLRPARAREDGSQEHLKLADLKQLLGWVLERYGLPPYCSHWVFERGTATLGTAVAAALHELLGPGRVQCHWTGMVGGTSPVGYAERKVGNANGKGMLESHNRLMHTIGAPLPGQTGPIYTARPADLLAREREALAIWELAQYLPEELRGQARYPLLTQNQARVQLRHIFDLQNSRTEHTCEGFEEVGEWFDADTGTWRHQSTAPAILPPSARVRVRRESPLERAGRLLRAVEEPWTRVSPTAITALYEQTQTRVTVTSAGQVEITHDRRPFRFRNPGQPLPAGTQLLAYFHPDDPRFLHLTDGRGSFVGTWLREGLVHDQDTLSQAIRYQRAAEREVRAVAADLAAPERAELDAMREHNRSLLAASGLETMSTPQPLAARAPVAPVDAALAAVAQQRQAEQRTVQAIADDAEEARRALLANSL